MLRPKIFESPPPSVPIYVVQEDSVATPSAWIPNWRQGGVPHLATKCFQGVPPYFPLMIFFWTCSLH